jgi:hypothetical protein
VTRITRSGSPPARFQRRLVSHAAARIATRSVSPYRWMESGPRWMIPLDGDGMYASVAGIARDCAD